jgi:MoxR-like ATPase
MPQNPLPHDTTEAGDDNDTEVQDALVPESWWAFRGPAQLPEPPPWRQFPASTRRARAPHYLMSADQVAVVNAALHLHRPLLVTGPPGTGKSSLAHAIAADLQLGEVLRWPVNSRSTLADALYRYDAVGRLREASLRRQRVAGPRTRSPQRGRRRDARQSWEPDIGSYLRLGPLGTALAAKGKPRVLLIDELDKADMDLPNDLLVVLEEGEFEIPELARLPEDQQTVDVLVTGDRKRVRVHRGTVSCERFPIVVMTSNGEQDLPAAFLRRCVRLDLQPPKRKKLDSIVRDHLGEEALAQADDLITKFSNRSKTEMLATDQLLAAVHLRLTGADLSREELHRAVLSRLDEVFPT